MNIPGVTFVQGINRPVANVASGKIGQRPHVHWGNDHVRVVPCGAESLKIPSGHSPVRRPGVEKRLAQRPKTTVNRVLRGRQPGGHFPCDGPRRRSSHVDKIPWQSRLYKCRNCGQRFCNQLLLVRHKESHKYFQCQQCHARFGTLVAQKNHLCLNPGYEVLYCSYCCLPFSSRGSLLYHLLDHAEKKSYQCPQCIKGGCSRYLLADHSKVHDDRNVIACSIYS